MHQACGFTAKFCELFRICENIRDNFRKSKFREAYQKSIVAKIENAISLPP
jgi:hypothetical protein